MLFRTFDPYIDDYMNDKNDKNMCFICYEINSDEMQTITLNLQEDYIKICECNGFVHNNCLKKWYDKASKCPICRKDVYKRITIPIITVNKGEYFYVVFCINFFKYINKIIRYIFLISFIYYCSEIYQFVLDKKTIRYDNYL